MSSIAPGGIEMPVRRYSSAFHPKWTNWSPSWCRSLTASSTLMPAAMTSGPMPSPGITAILRSITAADYMGTFLFRVPYLAQTMTRRLPLLPLLSFVLFPLLSTAALAQTGADVAVSILAPPTADARGFSWKIDVINNGPEIARNVSVTASASPPFLTTTCDRQTIDLIYGDSHQVVQCNTGPIGVTEDVGLHAMVFANNDRNSGDNQDTKFVHVIAGGADVGINVLIPRIDPGLPFKIEYGLFNLGAIPATGVTVTVTLPTGPTVTNNAPDIPAATPYSGFTSSFTLVVGDALNGRTLPITVDVHTTAPEGNLENNHFAANAPVARTFFVTQPTGDALTTAIDQANADCVDAYPCKIAFRLD